jgi:hypothetical protein
MFHICEVCIQCSIEILSFKPIMDQMEKKTPVYSRAHPNRTWDFRPLPMIRRGDTKQPYKIGEDELL